MKNPAAFPRPHSVEKNEYAYNEHYGQEGMSLRDYLAAKAMQAYVTNCQAFSYITSHYSVAKEAYELADAMLKEREKANA